MDRLKIRFYCQETKKYFYPNENFMYKLDKNTWANLSVMLASSNYTAEKCTGLKDNKGKLIYEGDICKCKNYTGIKIVEYMKSSCCFVFKNFATEISHHIEKDWCEEFKIEIIGNIHENPELFDCEVV